MGKPSLNPDVNMKDDSSVMLKNIFAEYFTYLCQNDEWDIISEIIENNEMFPSDVLIYDEQCNIISIAMFVYSPSSNDLNPNLAISKMNDSRYASVSYLAEELVDIWYDA